ncbi:MAG TPA: amidohydrolase family protein, partial [Methylomirabilota bacterium]|nr:amidohydrolase family protein [Methylomirabilota bacterium]
MKAPRLPYPNLVLYNGKIRSFVTETSTCEALACAGSRIAAAGDSDAIRRLAGPETEMIDLKGRTAIPGLTDTHVHLSEKGTAEMELVDCRDFYVEVASISDILQKIANAAASVPKGSWVVAHGSPMQDFRLKDKRFPDKRDLDRAAPDHPVSISFGAHITVANSLALGAAKITRDTPDPAGGHIKRDPQTGEPTGELHERAQLIVKKVAPEFNYLQLKDGIVFALDQCLRRGVTTVHDIVRYAEPVRAYQELYQEGRMHARVSILPRVIESMIESKSLIELGLITGFGNEWLRVGGVKMSIDGGITGRNACFYEPYE